MVVAGQKVLIIEDDDSLRPALERLLHIAGFQVATYASAEALLAEDAAAEGAACVVSDLKLPALSGFDLLTEMRARDGWPPLILITAHDAPGLREEAARRGAAAYLAKPFRGTALLETIEAVIEPARLDEGRNPIPPNAASL
ncbi:MAG: response regulator [Candidatus Contendobacter sp.]